MIKNLKDEKGITLVALIVTVIILLILSIVTITSYNTGGQTLINSAESKKDQIEKEIIKQEVEVSIEKVKLENSSEVNKNISEFIVKLQEKLRLNDSSAVVILNEDNPEEKYDVTYKGNTFSYYLNKKETAVLKRDASGKTYYLPNGFYYVGGIVDDGIVISDNREDEGKYAGVSNVGKDLKGNQYVWVPVDGENVKFEKHVYATPVTTSPNRAADTGNGNWPTYYYRYYIDWKDMELTGSHKSGDTTIYDYTYKMAENIESVEKYGGFYIARFEAGYAPAEAGTQHIGSKNSANRAPSSKANYMAWNNVSQINAALACKKLNEIESYSNVKASLIDGYAWDTAVSFISSKVSSVTDSRTYGAYKNGTSKEKNLLYYPFIYEYNTSTGSGIKWYQTEGKYKNSGDTEITLAITNMTTDALKEEVKEIIGVEELNSGSTYRRYIELATGAAESTKKNNIYDLAGNMYEWTTEIGNHSTENSNQGREAQTNENSFAVYRGGSFSTNGNNYPVCYRYGGNTVTIANIVIGFRSVLYIK